MFWQNLKAFFDYSETIFLARMESIIGFFIAAASALDWSPLLGLDYSTGLNQKQFIVIGSIMFVKGLITELVRRRPGSKDPIVPPTPVVPDEEKTTV